MYRRKVFIMATDHSTCHPGDGIEALNRLPGLAEPLLQIDLERELQQLRREDSWQRETGRSSKTLAKYPDFRIVLILMKGDTRMRQHRAEGRISIQLLEGQICIHLADRKVNMSAGHLLVLDCGVLHDPPAPPSPPRGRAGRASRATPSPSPRRRRGGFTAGQAVQISGVGVPGYNGTFTIVSVPSPTTFTYTNPMAPLAASGGGSAIAEAIVQTNTGATLTVNSPITGSGGVTVGSPNGTATGPAPARSSCPTPAPTPAARSSAAAPSDRQRQSSAAAPSR